MPKTSANIANAANENSGVLPKIAFQGELGANSHMACDIMYPEMTPLPCNTFEDAFNALEEGRAEKAMIPIENSIAGRVADIHYLLPRANFYIVGEFFLPIHFHVMAKPGVALEDIKVVYSHIHALGQCREFSKKQGWSAQISADTAGAARMVSQMSENDVASYSPHMAAELYGLNILASNVEDAQHNTTRFVVLARQEEFPQYDPAHEEAYVTTFTFKVRNIPASLYKVMGGFATNGVNMTKLESYQEGASFTATRFFADIQGHPDSPAVSLALQEMQFFCEEYRNYGTYLAADSRKR